VLSLELIVICLSRDSIAILIAVVRSLVWDTYTVQSHMVGAGARVALTIVRIVH